MTAQAGTIRMDNISAGEVGGIFAGLVALLAYFALQIGTAGLIVLGVGCALYLAVVIHNWRGMA